MENWKEVYLQIAERINTNMPEVEWVDLWHEQVPNTDDEYGFPSPAVFVAFRSTNVSDKANLIQNIDLQVDLYLYKETRARSHQGSSNQAQALGYLDTLTTLNKLFHGYSSSSFSTMRKMDIRCIDSSMSRYLYCISFSCMVEDSSALPTFGEKQINDIRLEHLSDSDLTQNVSQTGTNTFFYID